MLRHGVRGTLRRARIPLSLLLAAAALGVLARSGLLDPTDRAVAELARPGGSWGELQVRVDTVVEGLRPAVAAGGALLASGVAAVRDRAARPLVVTAAGLLATGAFTWMLQGTLGRPDPHGSAVGFDGSYPSGHTVTAAVAGALATRALLPGRPRLAVAAGGVLGVLMGTAVVLQVAHWASDVVGALLLSAGAVGLLEALVPSAEAHHQQ